MLSNHRPLEPPDPIGCPEPRLRALAAHFPEAKLEIEIQRHVFDTRGVIELPCPRGETDDACLTRARRQIPPGFVAVELDGDGYIDEAEEWEVTLDVGGRVVTERYAQPMLKTLEVSRAVAHGARLISERTIPHAENRVAVIWYGHPGPYREATLAFPPGRSVRVGHVARLEHQLHLHEDVSYV